MNRVYIFQSTPPCAGGDVLFGICSQLVDISIHAPLCGGRHTIYCKAHCGTHFNPRPPVRGATTDKYAKPKFAIISIHAPLCGGRRALCGELRGKNLISIHAPLCGGRRSKPRLLRHPRHFNPRPPVRGATKFAVRVIVLIVFQSTPPCAGGDRITSSTDTQKSDFNPRPPVRGAT